MSDDVCSQYSVTCEQNAETLRSSLIEIAGVSELFRALADETRTKILYLISQQELCVCDLALFAGYDVASGVPSLRFLRALRLVKTRKDGKNVFYSLDDAHVLGLMEMAKAHYMSESRHHYGRSGHNSGQVHHM